MSTEAVTHPLGEVVPDIEKPQNGVAGLKHWRYDLMAGLRLAMMGIPLSLGIAIASGAPHASAHHVPLLEGRLPSRLRGL